MWTYLYLGVFFSGLTTLAAELAASRLVGNYFGSSNLVWASIIGLILIYLTAGYTIGGRWADRSPHLHTFFKLLAWGGLLVGLIPLAARPILRFASQAFDQFRLGVLFGSFLSILVLFSAPVILLGCATPFAMRIAGHEAPDLGKVAGRLNALSTLGAFIGTFLPSLILIPLVGTYLTFVLVGGLLLCIALFCLAKTTGFNRALRLLWMPILLASSAWLGLRGSDKIAEGLLYESESQYNYIQVQELQGFRLLRLNEGQGVHSIYYPQPTDYHGPWEQVLVAPFFNPAPYAPENVQRIAILGLAAGTTARQANRVYPDAVIDGYEIDGKIIEVANAYFWLDQVQVNIFIEDARSGLTRSPHTYQVISLDAFKPPYIPWHLTTLEFFHEVNNHLTEDGVFVINVARIFDDRRLVNALATTLQQVFPSIYIYDLPDTFNTILFATKQPTRQENLLQNYNILETQNFSIDLLLPNMRTAIFYTSQDYDVGIVLTNDKAPVEWLTNAMLVDFVFSGAIQNLQ